MENRSHALWAGFFTISMLCATIFAGMWFNRDKTVRDNYQIVTTSAISGLNPQASVRYRGLAVGRVDNIEFDPDVPGQIIINVSVDVDTPITKSSFATLSYQGVTGIAFIELDDDGSNPVKYNLTDKQLPRIPLHPGLLEKLERNSTVILANAEKVSGELSILFAPENQKIILSAFSNTAQTTARWKQLADDIAPTLKLLPGLVQQTDRTIASVQQLTQSATGLSNHLSTLASQLEDPHGPLNHTLNAIGDLSDQLQFDTLPLITTLSNDTGNSMRTFTGTLQELKERPQSLVFGKLAPAPGPGEAGFAAPPAASPPPVSAPN